MFAVQKFTCSCSQQWNGTNWVVVTHVQFNRPEDRGEFIDLNAGQWMTDSLPTREELNSDVVVYNVPFWNFINSLN